MPIDEKKAVEALARAEWRGEGGYWEESACPVCGGSPYYENTFLYGPSPHPSRKGHGIDCALADVLEAAGVPQNRDG